MLSYGFFKDLSDILFKSVLNSGNILFSQKPSIFDSARSHLEAALLLLFFNEALWVVPSWRLTYILNHVQWNFNILGLLQNKDGRILALEPKFSDLGLFDSNPISSLALFVVLELVVKSSQKVCVYIFK